MAFSAITTRGSATEKTSDTSLAMSPSANLTVGKLVIVQCATDNDSTATSDGASTRHSLADSKSNTWTKIAEYTDSDGSAADGVTISLWYTTVTTQILTTDTITLTTSSAVTNKIISCFEATKYSNSTIAVETVGVGQSAIAATVSSLPRRQYLLVGFGGSEGNDNAKTADADYTEQFDLRTGSGTAATEICTHVVTRISVLTTDTCTSTAWTNTNPIFLLAPIYEVFPALSTLVDNHDDNSLDTGKWISVPGAFSISETNNRIELTTVNTAVNNEGWLASNNYFSLMDSYILAEIVDAAQTQTTLDFFPVEIFFPSEGQYASWHILNGTIYARYGGTNRSNTTYNATTHKWLKLREASGTIYWDYSSDGINWSNFYSATPGYDCYQIQALYIDTYELNQAAVTTKADNFNLYTKTSELLIDNFDDNSVNIAKWAVTSATYCVESSSVCQVTVPSTVGALAHWFASTTKHDLTGSFVSVEVVDAGNQALTSAIMYPIIVEPDANNYLLFRITGNVIRAYKKVSGTVTQVGSDLAYVAATHKYFRIREASGTTYWDWSTDGISWTNLTSASNPITVTDLGIRINVGVATSEASSFVTKVDNFNILPSGGTTYTPNLTDTFSFSEVLNKSTTHILVDTNTFGDVLNRLIGVVRSDTSGNTDSINRAIQRSLNDPISFSEIFSTLRTAFGLFVDSIVGSDGIVRNIQRNVSDTSTLSEVFSISRFLVSEYLDNFSFSEILTKSISIVRAENQAISDTIIKDINKNNLDTFSTSEDLTKISSKLRDLSDTVTPIDLITKQTTKELSNSISFGDIFERLVVLGKEVVDTFSTSEVITKVKAMYRELTDEVPVSDSMTKSITKVLTTTLTFGEKIIKHLNGFVVQWIKIAKTFGEFTRIARDTGSYTRQPKPTGDWTKGAKPTGEWTKEDKPTGDWTRGEPPIN